MRFLNICFLSISLVTISCQSSSRREIPIVQVQKHLLTQSDSLKQSLDHLLSGVQQKHDIALLQKQFDQARYHYKQLEAITELYFPGFSDAINGPAIDEEEVYEGKVIQATGFQVVEEYLFSDFDTTRFQDLLRETRLLSSMTNRLSQLITGNELTDQHVFQAIRLELLRIIALGISGFDSPVALHSLPEAKAALKGIEKMIAFYNNDIETFDKVRHQFDDIFTYLNNNVDFNTFNRAEFITDYIHPLSLTIYAFQQELGIANRDFLTAVNLNETNFFSASAYDIKYFSNPSNRNTNTEMIELGRLLFFDPVLSGNNKRACASCHNPSKAFSDGQVKSLAFESSGMVSRNAPSIINAAFQRMQFYDSRIMFQEDQVTDVMQNPTEMHGHIDEAVMKLKRSAEYVRLFKSVFGEESVNNRSIQKALAAYVRSLSSMKSNFDLYMQGDKSKLSRDEIAGFNLFMGKAKCGTCHFLPLFNGTIPPMFTKSESEVLGVPQKPDTINAQVDPDLGKFLVYGGDLNRHAFKTPTVRNAALTAPYMHNGVYHTLEQVIDFYNRGGGAGIGIELPNQTLPPDNLNLTTDEQKNIVKFIQSLTDTTGLTLVPSRLPSFSDPTLNQRRVGGEY